MNRVFYLILLVVSFTLSKFPTEDHKNFVRGVPAIGFQYDSGPAWAVICYDTKHGTVPGKLDNRRNAYYPWDYKEYECDSWNPVFGKLVHSEDHLPENCSLKGSQASDGNLYYNAVINSSDGMIPGKVNASFDLASYSYGSKEHPVTSGFYLIC